MSVDREERRTSSGGFLVVVEEEKKIYWRDMMERNIYVAGKCKYRKNCWAAFGMREGIQRRDIHM